MWSLPAPLRDMILGGAYEISTTVAVMRGGELVAANIPVSSCPVTATITTSDGRGATLVTSRDVTDMGLLDPLSDSVIISSGIRGLVSVPLFTGRVDAHAETETGEVAVALLSKRQEIARDSFETPFAVRPGATFIDEVTRIIHDFDSTIAVDASQIPVTHAHTFTDMVPTGLAWETDRAQALNDLTDAIHVLWLPDRTGGIALQTHHFVHTHDPVPVLTIRDGVDGVIVKMNQVKSRQDVFNAITLVVERTDNTLPIRVTQRDSDPGSPTLWGGPFGKQNRVIKINTPINASDASELAEHILDASLALTRTWRIEIPPNPLIDPGDVVAVWYRGEPTLQLVESISYPNRARASTVLATRQLLASTFELDS